VGYIAHDMIVNFRIAVHDVAVQSTEHTLAWASTEVHSRGAKRARTRSAASRSDLGVLCAARDPCERRAEIFGDRGVGRNDEDNSALAPMLPTYG
jgi:hypothetical protein